jgi:hypothetical protein
MRRLIAAVLLLTVAGCTPDYAFEQAWDDLEQLRGVENVCNPDEDWDTRVVELVHYLPDRETALVLNDRGGYDWAPGVEDQARALIDERCG